LTSEVATRPGRDYYAVLGVARTADRATIRRAFRSLASEFHPDVSTDPNSAERFRELAEAYEVLSSPDARARYDRLGFDPRGVGDLAARHPDLSRLFEDLLDLAGGAQRPGRRGSDVAAELEVAPDGAHKGVRRAVHYTAMTVCSACEGTGAGAGGAQVTCTECGGRGRIREGGASGRPSHLRLCAACRGSGRRPASPCRECDAAGRLEIERVLLVEVPPGAQDGDEFRIAGEGNAGGPGGEPGDLVVTVRVSPASDAPLMRKIAAAGALCGLGLIAFVIVVVVVPDL
jgi:molecular chaperone DnaJ